MFQQDGAPPHTTKSTQYEGSANVPAKYGPLPALTLKIMNTKVFDMLSPENMAIPSTSNVHYFEATLVLAPE